jgi:hypothetical protein
MAQQQPQPTRNDDIIGWIEDFLEDLVTLTPAVVLFTAAEIAAHYGDPVVEVSQWLQIYRKLQQSGRCSYRIATVERGPDSKWMILRFPGMTTSQDKTGAELLTHHEIMSLLRETIDPRLKNVTWEIVATMLDTPLRARSRSMITFEINIMGGFKTMLLTCQQDLRSVRPVHLRPVVAQTQAMLTLKINEIARASRALAAL